MVDLKNSSVINSNVGKSVGVDKVVKNVVIYARFGSSQNDSQVKSLSDYIDKHDGWNLVKVYKDIGVSGRSTKNRSGFNAMIEDALSGSIDLVVVRDVSTFSRSIIDIFAYTQMLKENNVDIVFIMEGIDTRDKDANLKLSMYSNFIEIESQKMSERIKLGIKSSKELKERQYSADVKGECHYE